MSMFSMPLFSVTELEGQPLQAPCRGQGRGQRAVNSHTCPATAPSQQHANCNSGRPAHHHAVASPPTIIFRYTVPLSGSHSRYTMSPPSSCTPTGQGRGGDGAPSAVPAPQAWRGRQQAMGPTTPPPRARAPPKTATPSHLHGRADARLQQLLDHGHHLQGIGSHAHDLSCLHPLPNIIMTGAWWVLNTSPNSGPHCAR